MRKIFQSYNKENEQDASENKEIVTAAEEIEVAALNSTLDKLTL